MPVCEWKISGPSNFAWTPAEIAQISRATQAFLDELPNATGKIRHTMSLGSINVLDGSVAVTWPQPGDDK